jgi:hypothetical protein
MVTEVVHVIEGLVTKGTGCERIQCELLTVNIVLTLYCA